MIIMADSGGYKPYMTSESAIAASSWTNRLSSTDGWSTEKRWGPNVTGKVTPTNMPTPTRHGAFVNVSAAIAENMHKWNTSTPTTLPAVDSATKAEYNAETRELTATVTAADKGTLAGSVKFSAGDWSKTVKLSAEGVATVTLPVTISGTVAVAYDGYTDGLVNPSSTEVAGIEQGKVDLVELNKQIAAAEALKESDYTADSWAALAKALQAAKAALASSDQAVVDKAAADLSAAIAALQKAETPTKPDTGDGDNKGDNAGDKTDNKTDDTKSDGKLPATGAAVYGVSGAMVLLAAAGTALSIWRKRRA